MAFCFQTGPRSAQGSLRIDETAPNLPPPGTPGAQSAFTARGSCFTAASLIGRTSVEWLPLSEPGARFFVNGHSRRRGDRCDMHHRIAGRGIHHRHRPIVMPGLNQGAAQLQDRRAVGDREVGRSDGGRSGQGRRQYYTSLPAGLRIGPVGRIDVTVGADFSPAGFVPHRAPAEPFPPIAVPQAQDARPTALTEIVWRTVNGLPIRHYRSLRSLCCIADRHVMENGTGRQTTGHAGCQADLGKRGATPRPPGAGQWLRRCSVHASGRYGCPAARHYFQLRHAFGIAPSRSPPAAGMASRIGSGHGIGVPGSYVTDRAASGAWARSSGFDAAPSPRAQGSHRR
jgi:hypothetical protein